MRIRKKFYVPDQRYKLKHKEMLPKFVAKRYLSVNFYSNIIYIFDKLKEKLTMHFCQRFCQNFDRISLLKSDLVCIEIPSYSRTFFLLSLSKFLSSLKKR